MTKVRNAWIAANVFNTLDALLTLLFISLGMREGNPLMAALISWHPGLFFAVKFAVFYWIASSWYDKGKLRMLQVSAALLGAVCVWNVVNIVLFLAR